MTALINWKDYFSEEQVATLTKELIKIPSHSQEPGRESEVGQFLHTYCQEKGLPSELVPVDGERANCIVHFKGKGTGKTLMLNGHLDTVPPYQMTIDPYAAEERDGAIWGRGAVDMKGPIAAMIVALLALKKSPYQPDGDVIFTGVIGEEEKSEGTEDLVNKGIKADGAIVGEASGDEYAIGHRGLEWLEIEFTGKAAHGGMAHLGVNAIEHGAEFITRVKKELYPKLKERQNPTMGPATMNFGTIEGGTQPSTVADRCVVKLDRRLVTGETVEGVIAEYQDIIDDMKEEDPTVQAKISRVPENMLTMDHLPMEISPDHPLTQSVREALQEVLGKEPGLNTRRGWTDASLLSNFAQIPCVVYGPGSNKRSHSVDEHIKISELVEGVLVYLKVIEKFCGLSKK